MKVVWDADETRDLILHRFGREQLEKARPCLRSLSDRQIYAAFHFQRSRSTLHRYIKKYLHKKDFVAVALGVDAEEWQRFNWEIRKVGADLVACVQSLHAIPDILASAVYYSLGLDRQYKPRLGRYVNHEFVMRILRGVDHLEPLAMTVGGCTESDTFRHLAALSNQSKHYSIMFPVINGTLSGVEESTYEINFPEFQSKGKKYSRVAAFDFLMAANVPTTRSVVDSGVVLNGLLKTERDLSKS